METRLNILGTAIAYVSNTDEPNNPLSMELVLRKYFQMSDEEYSLNEKMKAKERNLNQEISQEYGPKEDEEGGEEVGSEEEVDDSSSENKKGLGGGLGGERDKSSPQDDEKPDPKEKPKEESVKYISERALNYLKKDRNTKKIL
jgi:hypothetical protein